LEVDRIFIVKRSGEMEPFAMGRIALAVFKASQAIRPTMPPSVARVLGAKIGGQILAKLAEGNVRKVEVELVQDLVVAALRAEGQSGLADVYQDYREGRMRERGKLSHARKMERTFKFSFKSNDLSRNLEFSRDDWASVLSKALSYGVGSEWSVSLWWGACKDLVANVKSFDEFVGYHIKVLLENSDGRESWLKTASGLLLERWFFRVLGVSPLFSGQSDVDKSMRVHYKQYWVKRKTLQKSEWFPTVKDLDFLLKKVDSSRDRFLGFAGLVMMESAFGFGDDMLLPQEIFANVSFALGFSGAMHNAEGVDRSAIANDFFDWQATGVLVAPLALMRQARVAVPSISQELSLNLVDSLESIFAALSKTASSAKSGNSVSVDLTPIRADGSPLGVDGHVSAGILPVLRLFGEACLLLKGTEGEKQKARLSLSCWHKDVESFLSFSKVMPKEMRLSLYLPDSFMRKVFEGGDWLLASPADVPHLVGSKGLDFDRWVREYVQMAKFAGLGQTRSVHARELFDWICQCIASSGGPSIVFSDACISYAEPLSVSNLSARMSAIYPHGEDIASVEMGVKLTPDTLESTLGIAKKCLNHFAVLSAAYEKKGAKIQFLLAPVGCVELGQFAMFVSGLSSQQAIDSMAPLKRGSLWSSDLPWESRFLHLAGARGGYIEKDDDVFSCEVMPSKRKTGLPAMISMSSREEYLWMANSSPVYVNHDTYRHQVWFEGVRSGFGGSGGVDSVKKQVKRAARWQSWADGALAFDVRLDAMSPDAVGEAIKLSWLNGLVGVRRFIGN